MIRKLESCRFIIISIILIIVIMFWIDVTKPLENFNLSNIIKT